MGVEPPDAANERGILTVNQRETLHQGARFT